MKLHQLILTENNCYKAGRKINVKGLMLHSTGANNPKLSRYVGPDDGILGVNKNNNHWNQPLPGGREVCVHGFIGLDKNGEVRTYQTLPWNHRGWHGGGKSNDTHIGVEICEADLNDAEYFKKVYKEAVELFAYLCKEFNLTEKDIIDHTEGHKLGIASNHGDVMHWFPKHGKSMDTFRADVKKELGGVKEQPKVKSVETLAREVIAGAHGNGEARKKSLGARYAEVQKRVDELMGNKTPAKPAPAPKPTPKPQPSVEQLAREVIDGKWGSGADRKKRLGNRYEEVQKRVNEILLGSKKPAKTISQLADEVIKGLHGSGRERMVSLGSNYSKVQQEVNRRLRK